MEPVKYKLSKQEFVHIIAFRYMSTKKFIIAEIVLLILTLISMLMELSIFSYGLVPLVLMVCLPFFIFYQLTKSVNTNPDLFTSEKILNIENEGIKVKSANISSNINWSFFKKWTENNKYIFLYSGNSLPSIIPKRAFTIEQLTEFKTLLSEKIRPS